MPPQKWESDEEVLQSCVRILQVSYLKVSHVFSLYSDPRSIERVFRLLGRDTNLFADENFSTWNILKGNGPVMLGPAMLGN